MLYELRNTLAHNIGQVSFTFEQYLMQLDKQQKSSFIKRAGYGLTPTVEGLDRDSFVTQNPTLALWLTVSEILACLHLDMDFWPRFSLGEVRRFSVIQEGNPFGNRKLIVKLDMGDKGKIMCGDLGLLRLEDISCAGEA
ncbi:hypothetical protein [Massilia aquatica]|uniref:Transcriptional regulator n=1 Tax=Massilia aquatica TaxID=2609000 RepID=A0ABX0MBU1_9BURK|nr:hypothetical protein [Massilia aquatica]NHZ43794.1 hypothetical protein [Massilia aquatica]